MEKKTLSRQKSLVIVTPEKQYHITMFSIFRSYLNLIVKGETEICIERHSSATKIHAIRPNKWRRQMSWQPMGRSVENFPESYKRKDKKIRSEGKVDPETGRILLIYPPVQNVFYQTKNFYTDSITEVMFNGCQVDGTELYSLNGFCKVLNSRDRQEAARERSEA